MSALGRGRLPVRLPGWGAPVGVGVMAVLGCIAIAVSDPETRAELSPGCPFRSVTGLDCPGCGGTRAVFALTRGDIAVAASHNLFVLLLIPLLGWAWSRWLRVRLGRHPRMPDLPAPAAFALAGATIAFWLLRNVPWWPLSWLGSAA